MLLLFVFAGCRTSSNSTNKGCDSSNSTNSPPKAGSDDDDGDLPFTPHELLGISPRGSGWDLVRVELTPREVTKLESLSEIERVGFLLQKAQHQYMHDQQKQLLQEQTFKAGNMLGYGR